LPFEVSDRLNSRPAHDQKRQGRRARENVNHRNAARGCHDTRDRVVQRNIDAAADHHLRSLSPPADVGDFDLHSLFFEEPLILGDPQRRETRIAKGHSEVHRNTLREPVRGPRQEQKHYCPNKQLQPFTGKLHRSLPYSSILFALSH
jgi:hypothetical protein